MISTFLVAAQLAVAANSARPAMRADDAPVPPKASASVAQATRATHAITIDGRADEPVWRTAQVIDGFRQYDPSEDVEPRFRTEARVLYDDRNLYVLVRMFDPRPDSILPLLSRRDQRTPSDQIKVIIDSYHDRRSGYEFAANAAGVKRDYLLSDDGNEDDSWDGVWDVGTSIDKDGWVAEFKIPLSQLRFPKADRLTFGFGVFRDVQRYGERYAWPVFRRSKSGVSSQLAELRGLDGIPARTHLEVTPYTVTKNASHATATGFDRQQTASGGADIKYGLTSNLTVDATINPDFGQVEADPSVLNLTAFEQFYQERRPFFLEGAGIFQYDLNCNDGQCSGLFYSRRIGRAPQLSGLYSDAANPTNTSILGAAKLTGRLANGLSIGLLDAMTQREVGQGSKTLEPASNYGVLRLKQDFRNGNSGVGLMATTVNRQNDEWSRDYLRQSAYTVGGDFRHRFWKNNYQVSGYLAMSRVDGTEAAMSRLQRSAVHNYQRPGSGLEYDSTLTSMGGATMQLAFQKQGGGHIRGFSGYQRTTPGFEINDLGFLSRADQQSVSHWWQYSWRNPTKVYRQAMVNFNQWTLWNTGGQQLEMGGNINAHSELANRWWVHAGINQNAMGASYDDRVARGGPAVRQQFNRSGWAGMEGNPNWKIQPNIFFMGQFRDASGSWAFGMNPELAMRVGGRLQARLGVRLDHFVTDNQWYDNIADGAGKTHYTFAHLDQHVASMTSRLDFTATRTLSVQVYAAPFVATGKYTDWKELADPTAARYAARYKSYAGTGGLSNFNFKEFRSNTVVRWEYLPGSTLFFVWQQGRQQDGLNAGTFQASRDVRDLFKARPDNTLLIKASYWFAL